MLQSLHFSPAGIVGYGPEPTCIKLRCRLGFICQLNICVSSAANWAAENIYPSWSGCCSAMHFGMLEYNTSQFNAKLCIAWGFQITSCTLLWSLIYAEQHSTLPGNNQQSVFEEHISMHGKNLCAWTRSQIDDWWMFKRHISRMRSRMQWWVRQPAVDI